ncbi:MAG: hemerythrin family protein [Gammaproteobacteria bacterium]|nr:hemerythrin family protein [Gammaproteobacteria bacterium]
MTETPNSPTAGGDRAPVPLLAWKSEYDLGIPDVDHEHRELFDLINELHASLFEPESLTTVSDFLGELFSRISSHFALEERLMRDGRYADFPAHKSDHERLLDEIRDLMDDYEDGGYADLERFAVDLERWFSVHFSTHDAALHRWSAPTG